MSNTNCENYKNKIIKFIQTELTTKENLQNLQKKLEQKFNSDKKDVEYHTNDCLDIEMKGEYLLLTIRNIIDDSKENIEVRFDKNNQEYIIK